MNLTFTGGKELARVLRQLPEAIAERVLSGSVLAGAGVIADAASLRAPRKSVRRRTGRRLADSIKARVVEKARSFVTVHVGPTARYAHLVEYGHQIVARGPNRTRVRKQVGTRLTTRRVRNLVTGDFMEADIEVPVFKTFTGGRSTPLGGAIGFVPPRPFMRPAFDETHEAVIRKIGEVMEVGIEAEAKRLANENKAPQ